MNIRKLAASMAALYLLLGAMGLAQQAGKAHVEGIVTRAGSGLPLAGARVTLMRDFSRPIGFNPNFPGAEGQPSDLPMPVFQTSGRFPPNPGAIEPVTTDDQGRFTIDGVDPGTWRLQVQANGYVGQAYGQRQAEGPGTPITLTAGQTFSDINIQLTPGGNISGRIRDQDQRPVVGVPVALLRAAYDANGQQTLQPAGGAKTNDRGEYRIYWVSPGRYFLRAGNPAGGSPEMQMLGIVGGPGTPNPNEVPAEAGDAFFPGTRDAANARSVVVTPGGDLAGIDWALPAQPPTYRVRARIVDSKTGQKPLAAEVLIVPADPARAAEEFFLFAAFAGGGGFGPSYNPATGFAEFRNLAPGVYNITAMVSPFPEGIPNGPMPSIPAQILRGPEGELIDPALIDEFQIRKGVEEIPGFPGLSTLDDSDGPVTYPGGPLGMSTGSTRVAVSDADIDDIVITTVPAGSIEGRLRLEGAQPSNSAKRMNPNIQLVPLQMNGAQAFFGGTFSNGVRPDGSFRIENVTTGEYRLAAQPLPENAFIKEARLDGVDVLTAPLVVRGSIAGTLDVVISATGGQIRGTLIDEQSAPVGVMQVVLVPDRGRERPDLYKAVATDAAGKFTITGIPPGSYKLFSWDAVEPFGWFNPDLLERSESKAKAVTIEESATETVEVKIISRAGGQ